MTGHTLFSYPYASFTDARLPLLRVAALYFDKVVILDPVAAGWAAIGADRPARGAELRRARRKPGRIARRIEAETWSADFAEALEHKSMPGAAKMTTTARQARDSWRDDGKRSLREIGSHYLLQI